MFTKKTFHNLPKAKQDRITSVALEEFGSKGYQGASINAMVERLSIAKGSIFQYFGDKKGLFLFVFEQSMEMVKNHLRNVRDQSIDDPLELRLRKTLLSGIDFIRQHPLLYRLYLRISVESRLPFREEILLSLRQNSLTFLGELLDDARGKGELRKEIPTGRAAFMLDAIMDRFLQAHVTPHLDAGLGIHQAEADRVSAWVDSLVDILCRGISLSVPAAEKSKSSYLLIVAAVQAELNPLLSRMELSKTNKLWGRAVTSGTVAGIPVRLLETGPGLINAVQSITALVENQRPAAVIMTGCGGAFASSGLEIGDIALASDEIDAHSGVESGNGRPLAPLPFALLDNPGDCINNIYRMEKPILDGAWRILTRCHDGKSGVRVHMGRFLTVSTITATPETADRYCSQYAPCMEQMEGAGGVHVSLLYGIPFLEIRGVSNKVGNRDHTVWNIPLAAERACGAVYEVIRGMGAELLNLKVKR